MDEPPGGEAQAGVVQAVVVPLLLTGTTLIGFNRALFLFRWILRNRCIAFLEQAVLARQVKCLLLGFGAEQLLLEPVQLALQGLDLLTQQCILLGQSRGGRCIGRRSRSR